MNSSLFIKNKNLSDNTMNVDEKIAIVGAGFVGLVTAAIFADRGVEVFALDVDKEKVTMINQGKTFFFEPHLSQLLMRVVHEKKTLKASSNIVDTVILSDIIFICVGTPTAEDGRCDLQNIHQVATDIGKAIAVKNTYQLIVVKSTVAPETTRTIVLPLLEKHSGKKAGKDFGLCMSPEFLREGQSVYDSIYPDRIIIGKYDDNSGKKLQQVFKTLYSKEANNFYSHWEKVYGKEIVCPKILHYSLETAECIKYANNSFLATKISFINEFANICERIPGVDINYIAEAIGLDFRINPKFLQAGAGFGGSCFPKDVRAIIHFAKSKDYSPQLLEAILLINEKQAKHMVELTEGKLGPLKGKTISLLGLSFKPDTDDMRNAPSIKIVNYLLEKGAKVIAWDPKAMPEARKEIWIGEKIIYAKSLQEAIKSADACLLVTEWQEFKELSPNDFKVMKQPILIDGRRIYQPKRFIKEGIEYVGIGLGI